MEERGFSLDMTLRDGYEFGVRFDEESMGEVVTDEPPPLGQGAGPSPSRLLAAAVGNCMSASLLFCLRRARIDVPELRTTVEGTMGRNESGRLRIAGLKVTIHPGLDADDLARSARCQELFQDFCIVGESVRQGIPIEIEVAPVAPVPALTGSDADADALA